MTEKYRSSQLPNLWGVGERQCRYILGELEVLGFKFESDYYGSRQVPAPVVRAVRAARQSGKSLESLRSDPTVQRYLKPAERGGGDLDPLAALIEARGELAILREVIGAMHDALQGLNAPSDYQEPSWSFLTLPDPRLGL